MNIKKYFFLLFYTFRSTELNVKIYTGNRAHTIIVVGRLLLVPSQSESQSDSLIQLTMYILIINVHCSNS